MGFKVLLANFVKDKKIPDKLDKSHKIAFDIITLVDYNLDNNLPSGKVLDKWLQKDSDMDFVSVVKKLDEAKKLVIGTFYWLTLDITGNCVNLVPFDEKSKVTK